MRKLCTALALPLMAGLSGLGNAKPLPAVDYEKFATGFTAPLSMIPYQDGERAFVVLDQIGVASFLGEDGGEANGTFLDLRDRIVTLKPKFDERGLLGMALHPKFTENKKFYVYYSAPLRDGGPEGFDHTARLSEFKVKGDGTGDPATERILLQIDQPQWNHNCGNLLFGPDGYLYLGLGDGGKANDDAPGHEEDGNGQALHRLLGKILRIDVNSGDPYSIPPDNPLVGKTGRDEIYAWGIRNPWGLSFGPDGKLIVADVGQNRFEEINVIQKGGNFGWRRYEGHAPFNVGNPAELVTAETPKAPDELAAPVLVYPHNETYGEAPGYGISITGGYVYRGKEIPGLEGAYVFADWATSWATRKAGLFAGLRGSADEWKMEVLPGAKTPEGGDTNVVAFAEGRDGELYVLTNKSRGPAEENGVIWKIVAAR